jgi:DNA-binding protein YbaB
MVSSKPSGQDSVVDERLGRYADMRDEIAAIKAIANSTDRTVTVVAGPAGAVLDVRLTEQAVRTGSAASLSASIMSALRLAVADAARQQAEIVQRYVGDRLNIVDRVMKTQQDLLGDKIEAGEQEAQRLAATQGQSDGVHPNAGNGWPAAPVQPAPQVQRPPRHRAAATDDETYDPFAGGGRGDSW